MLLVSHSLSQKNTVLLALGNWSLHLAYIAAAATVLGALTGTPGIRIHNFCRRASIMQCLLLAGAWLCLTGAFVVGNLAAPYVARNSHADLPLLFRVTGAWGEHEGSLLLWVVLTAAWGAVAAVAARRLNTRFATAMLGTCALVSGLLAAFVAFRANPFGVVTQVPRAGADLNPLLQHATMAIHPPLLYAGFAGTVIPFAFHVAVARTGQIMTAPTAWLRPFVTLCWALLTAGIVTGSHWAYVELGWGGWWFWDPVENVALIPWLLGTALLHALIAAPRFPHWAAHLSFAAFALAACGAFVVRSGLLGSVHSFATAPGRARLLLGGLVVVTALATAWYGVTACREKARGVAQITEPRSVYLLINNLLLTTAAVLVFAGTFYPMLVDVTVGAPWFETVLLLPVLALLAAMAFGMAGDWHAPQWSTAWSLAAVSCAAIAAVTFMFGIPAVVAALGCAAGAGVVWAAVVRLLRTTRSFPMCISHCGIGLLAAGMTIAGAFGMQADRSLATATPARIGPYEVRLRATRTTAGPNYRATVAELELRAHDRDIASLAPERRWYPTRQVFMSETAIDSRWTGDVVATLGADLGASTHAVRLQLRPLIRLVWLGGALIVLGGLLAILRAAGRHVRS